MNNNICPWQGFKPYTEDDTQYFNGRTEAINALLQIIEERTITVCYAESGIGKSSLINAGIIPNLREKNFIPIHIRFDFEEFKNVTDNNEIESLFRKQILAIFHEAKNLFEERNKPYKLLWELPEEDVSLFDLWKALRVNPKVVVSFGGMEYFNNYKPFLIFDQFEQMLYDNNSPLIIETFFNLLKALVLNDTHREKHIKLCDGIQEPSDPFKVLVSIRQEYVGVLDYWCMTRVPMPSLHDNRYCLQPLTEKEAREVILPVGYDIFEKAADKIIEIAKENNFVSSILLSVICRSLFEQAPFLDGRKAPVTDTEVENNKDSIIETYYDEQIKSTDIPATDIANIENVLVDDDGNRQLLAVKNESLQGIRFTDSTRKLLEDNGIIHTTKVGHSIFVELIHDRVAEVVYKLRKKRKEEERVAALEQEKEKKRRNLLRKLSTMSIISVLTIFLALVVWQVIKVSEFNDRLRGIQIRAVAAKAMELIEEGDSYTAILLALQISPSDFGNRDNSFLEPSSIIRKALERNDALLREHTSSVNTAVFSVDGKLITSASDDTTIRIWNAETGELVNKLTKDHNSPIKAIAYSYDNMLMASASDKTIRIWDENFCVFRILIPDNKKENSEYQDSYRKKILSGGTKSLNEKNYMFKTEEQTSPPFKLGVNFVSWSSTINKLVSAYTDGTIRIWWFPNTNNDNRLLKGHTSGVNSVIFSPDEKWIVSASDDETIMIWDGVKSDNEPGRPIKMLKKRHTDKINFATFSPDGTRIVSASDDKTVRIWDEATGDTIKTLQGHTDGVNYACFSPDGTKIVSASNDKTIRIWDATTGDIIKTLHGHTDRVNSASFSPDGTKIVSASNDNTVRIWDISAKDGIAHKPLQQLIDETRERFKNRQLTPEERRTYYLE